MLEAFQARRDPAPTALPSTLKSQGTLPILNLTAETAQNRNFPTSLWCLWESFLGRKVSDPRTKGSPWNRRRGQGAPTASGTQGLCQESCPPSRASKGISVP